MSTLDDWLTVREAADEILGVTPQRVHQLIHTYEMETQQLGGHLLLVKRSDVEEVAKRERPSGVHVDRQPKHNGQRRKR